VEEESPPVAAAAFLTQQLFVFQSRGRRLAAEFLTQTDGLWAVKVLLSPFVRGEAAAEVDACLRRLVISLHPHLFSTTNFSTEKRRNTSFSPVSNLRNGFKENFEQF
jgi:hypothetical protein